MRSVRHRRGYVLLVTLGLLVLASTLLVAVGRSAVRHVLAAQHEQDELQRRWGVISCRQAILPYSEQILATMEDSENRAVPSYRDTVNLGGQQFLLIVADEQAKANVNLLLETMSVAAAEDRLRESVTGEGISNHVRLRPSILAVDLSEDAAVTTQPAAPVPLISGPGQIFDAIAPEQLIGSANSAAPLDSITCWGSGPINIFRATEPAMQLALRPALTQLQIQRLIQARDRTMQISRTSRLPVSIPPTGGKSNNDAIASLLNQAGIDPKNRGKIAVVSGSTCHSLWIVVQDRQRSWDYLTVSDESNPKSPQIDSFMW
jgi:hypothetical protein